MKGIQPEYVIGVDLGGTKIATVICDFKCNIIAQVKVDTRAKEGVSKVVQRIKDTVYKVIEMAGVTVDNLAGICISSPGPLNTKKGVVLSVATLGWENIPISKIISDEFNVPVYLENDANVAAYGEKCFGAGIGCKDLIYITVSTGVGSGIIINNKIYHGKHDSSGEFGHICIERGGKKCSCGNNGCLQAYASGTAIADIAKEEVRRNRDSKILNYSNNCIEHISCLSVEKAAIEKDNTALKIWTMAGINLGHGISILMQMFDPEMVIIGGGVSNAWDLFYPDMMDTIRLHTYKLIFEDCAVVRAKLGANAGALGAAMIAVDNLHAR